jgi:hypothetical protein
LTERTTYNPHLHNTPSWTERLVTKSLDAAKVLLNVKVTGLLPAIVLEREQAGLSADAVHDLLHGSFLLLFTSNSHAVGDTGAGPADLGDVLALGSSLGADFGSLLELLGGKVTGHVGGDRLGEVGVDLDGEDVNVRAEGRTVLLPGTDRLSGCDSDIRGETAANELLTDVVDVGTELTSLAVVVEDALVSNNDHCDRVLGSLLLNVVELVVGMLRKGSLAAGLKKDTVDDLQSVLLALGNDVLEDTTVGGVRSDGSEAELGDLLDVGGDLAAGLAVTGVGVRGVGNGPLVAVRLDVISAAVAASRLGLSSGLGAAGDSLGALRRLGRSGNNGSVSGLLGRAGGNRGWGVGLGRLNYGAVRSLG